jgi:hypothetical protein
MKSGNGNNPKFCLEVWSTDYNKVKSTCILAEKLGYHGFYYGESLADIDLDCWTILSNLSAITNEIKLGPVITLHCFRKILHAFHLCCQHNSLKKKYPLLHHYFLLYQGLFHH